MYENKTFFFINIFFWRKPGFLIPDLYLYNIKIQTDIDQNTVIKLQKNHKFFEIIFWRIFIFYIYFFLGLDPARPTWLGWTQQASCEQWNISDANSEIHYSRELYLMWTVNLAFHCSSELYFTWTVKCKEMVHAQRRRGCKPGGRNDGEHSQWCWWRWRGSRWGLPVVLTVAVAGKRRGWLQDLIAAGGRTKQVLQRRRRTHGCNCWSGWRESCYPGGLWCCCYPAEEKESSRLQEGCCGCCHCCCCCWRPR